MMWDSPLKIFLLIAALLQDVIAQDDQTIINGVNNLDGSDNSKDGVPPTLTGMAGLFGAGGAAAYQKSQDTNATFGQFQTKKQEQGIVHGAVIATTSNESEPRNNPENPDPPIAPPELIIDPPEYGYIPETTTPEPEIPIFPEIPVYPTDPGDYGPQDPRNIENERDWKCIIYWLEKIFGENSPVITWFLKLRELIFCDCGALRNDPKSTSGVQSIRNRLDNMKPNFPLGNVLISIIKAPINLVLTGYKFGECMFTCYAWRLFKLHLWIASLIPYTDPDKFYAYIVEDMVNIIKRAAEHQIPFCGSDENSNGNDQNLTGPEAPFGGENYQDYNNIGSEMPPPSETGDDLILQGDYTDQGDPQQTRSIDDKLGGQQGMYQSMLSPMHITQQMQVRKRRNAPMKSNRFRRHVQAKSRRGVF